MDEVGEYMAALGILSALGMAGSVVHAVVGWLS